jgi:hypothetical protein
MVVESYIVRFDRIILPELLFNDYTEATKAMELSMLVAGAEVKAKVGTFDPITDLPDYTLPRNTWLHLDAKINNTTLELNPTVRNWNTVAMEDVVFDGKYTLEVDRQDIIFPADGNLDGAINVTTNHPGSLSIVSQPADVMNSWLDVRGHEGVVLPDGIMTTSSVEIRPTVNDATNAPSRSCTLTITVGNLRKTVRVIQAGPKNDLPPTGVTPYVGAFWKADQTGERLIRIPRPESGAIDGRWSAQVVNEGVDWIVLDRMMTDDPNVGWLPGADEHLADFGNDPGFDTRYAVHGGTDYIEGTVSAADPDGIYFRIGLTGEHNVAWGKPVRYAVVLLSYTSRTSPTHRIQPIWIRQGEMADFVFSYTDPVDGVLTARSKAMQISPYNLTAATLNTQVGLNGKEPNPGIFTDYPSQAGALFTWASVTARYAFSPIDIASDPVTPQASVITGYWNTIGAQQESCPSGYHRPSGGPIDRITSVESVAELAQGVIQQSLLLTPKLGIDEASSSSPDNSLFGYYADGWFDRRAIVSSSTGTPFSTVAASDPHAVAYCGRLFYNKFNNASIFLPFSGNRAEGAAIANAGSALTLWTSSSNSDGPGRNGIAFTGSSTGTNMGNNQAIFGRSIRCVVNTAM